jgi:hypothetical protein
VHAEPVAVLGCVICFVQKENRTEKNEKEKKRKEKKPSNRHLGSMALCLACP